MKQEISNGNYFLHSSLLMEASERWIIQKQETTAGKLFLRLFCSRGKVNIAMCACDRTLRKISEKGHKLAFLPAMHDVIDEKSLRGYDQLDDDQYCLKVASLKATLPFPIYMLVSDAEKKRITDLADSKGYHSVKILSPLDFGEKEN